MKRSTTMGLTLCSTIFLFGFLDCKGETSSGGGPIYQVEAGEDIKGSPIGSPVTTTGERLYYDNGCSVESGYDCND